MSGSARNSSGETSRSAAANTARNTSAIPTGTKSASISTFHTGMGGKDSSITMPKSSIPKLSEALGNIEQGNKLTVPVASFRQSSDSRPHLESTLNYEDSVPERLYLFMWVRL